MTKESIEKILNELKEADKLREIGEENPALMKMLDYGKKLVPFPDEFKKSENLVTKCMSIVHLTGHEEKGKMKYIGTSDAKFVKGELYIILSFFEGMTPEETLSQKTKDEYSYFISELKKIVPISMTRTQGFEGAYERIVKIAKKFYEKT